MPHFKILASIFIVCLCGVLTSATTYEDPEDVYRRSYYTDYEPNDPYPYFKPNTNDNENTLRFFEMYRAMIVVNEKISQLTEKMTKSSNELKTLRSSLESLAIAAENNQKVAQETWATCRSAIAERAPLYRKSKPATVTPRQRGSHYVQQTDSPYERIYDTWQEESDNSGQGMHYNTRQDESVNSGQGMNYNTRQDESANSGQGMNYNTRQQESANSGQGMNYNTRERERVDSQQGDSTITQVGQNDNTQYEGNSGTSLRNSNNGRHESRAYVYPQTHIGNGNYPVPGRG